MAKILFHSSNLIDLATLTHSAEDPEFPVENLIDEQISITSRSTSTSDMNIVAAHGSPVAASELVIPKGHNLPSGTTITLQRHTADSWATPDFSEAVAWNAGAIVHRFTSNTKAFTRIRIQPPSAQVVELPRIILNVAKTLARNFMKGYRKRKIDYTENVESTGNQSFANLKSKVSEWEIIFKASPADTEILEAFFDEVGIGKHLAISFFPDSALNAKTYYGKLISQLEYAGQGPQVNIFSAILFREAT